MLGKLSNSEIVNLKKVLSFDLSFAGTICVSLSDGTSSYVSRRYVNKIKKILGIGNCETSIQSQFQQGKNQV